MINRLKHLLPIIRLTLLKAGAQFGECLRVSQSPRHANQVAGLSDSNTLRQKQVKLVHKAVTFCTGAEAFIAMITLSTPAAVEADVACAKFQFGMQPFTG